MSNRLRIGAQVDVDSVVDNQPEASAPKADAKSMTHVDVRRLMQARSVDRARLAAWRSHQGR
jgi:hypothetical protein